jgi:Fur family ferric uptake transcriptional regulator
VSTVDETAARLGNLGHRVTGPRKVLLDAILEAKTPFTIEELCALTPEVGRATVFRTVKLLQEMEVICRLQLEDGGIRYQVSGGGHHHHLVCSNCGSVSDFNDPELDALIQRNANDARFRLGGHSLELYGRCSNCTTA